MKPLSVLVFLAAWLFAFPVLAEPPAESAQSLFLRARTLMKTGDCAGALPLLEQSHALEPTVGTRFNMAICEGRLGKLVQARDHLRSVVEASAPDDERREHADRALRDLVPRIPYLVIALDEPRLELELVRLDAEPLRELRVNEPFAINPGTHELEVVLAGESPQHRKFSVAERQGYTWSLGGANAGPVSSSAGTAKLDSDARNDSAKNLDVTPAGSIWTTQRSIAVVAAGTSLAAFGVGTGFALSARSLYDSSQPDCTPDDECKPEGVRLRDRARERGRIATVAMTVGVASALAAGTLWFTGGPRVSSRSSPSRIGLGLGTDGVAGTRVVIEGTY